MKRLCLTFFFLICASCIPAYLPAYSRIKPETPFFDDNLNRLVNKQTIVIVKEIENTENNSLGHQYLFGIIPFTSIYLSEPADQLAINVLEDILNSFGFKTIISKTSEIESISNTHNIYLLIKGRIKNLSISGFDALFFRYLTVSGNLELESFKNIESLMENHKEQEENYSLQSSKFKFTAHLSELNLLLEKSLRDAAIKFATKL